MLFDVFKKALILFLQNISNDLPNLSVDIPSNAFDKLNVVMSNIGYVLPVAALMPILVISIGLSTFRIVWALIIRIKSFIPTMGA